MEMGFMDSSWWKALGAVLFVAVIAVIGWCVLDAHREAVLAAAAEGMEE